MRCRLGLKKTKRLRELSGLPVVVAVTRGNTDHRIDLYLEDYRIASGFGNGPFEVQDGDRHGVTPDRWVIKDALTGGPGE